MNQKTCADCEYKKLEPMRSRWTVGGKDRRGGVLRGVRDELKGSELEPRAKAEVNAIEPVVLVARATLLAIALMLHCRVCAPSQSSRIGPQMA